MLDTNAEKKVIIKLKEHVKEPFGTNGINIKYLGAKGDGITNDSAAFLRAIKLGYSIYVPEGVYLVDQMLGFTYDFTLTGDGKGKSIIKFAEHIQDIKDDWLVRINCDNFNLDGVSFIYETTIADDTENHYVENEGILCKVINGRKNGYVNNCSFECLHNGTSVKMTPFWIRNTEDNENIIITNSNFINTNKTQTGGAFWASPSGTGYLKSLIVSNCYMYHTNADETIGIWKMADTAKIGNVLISDNSVVNNNVDHLSDNILSVNGVSDESLITVQNNNFHCTGGFKVYFKFLAPHILFSGNKVFSTDEVLENTYFLQFFSSNADDITIKDNIFKVSTTGVFTFVGKNMLLQDNIFDITAYNFVIHGSSAECFRFIGNTFDITLTCSTGGFGINAPATIIFERNTFVNIPKFCKSGSDMALTLKLIENHFKSCQILLQAAVDSILAVNNICDEGFLIQSTSTNPISAITMMNNIASSYYIQYNWKTITADTALSVADSILCANNRTYKNTLYECQYEKTTTDETNES